MKVGSIGSAGQVQAIEKLRRPDGRVVGFRDQNGQIRQMFDGGATRKRRLEILSRKLALFVIGEFDNCPNARECEAILKLNEALGLIDKAGEFLK